MWFSASILYSSHHDPRPSDDRLWEESILLIEATGEDEARRTAEGRGRAAELSYQNSAGARVSWKFECVAQVHELLMAPADGVEVFSRFLRESEARSLQAKLD